MPYPASYKRILHRMGYYDYQQGFIFRHINQDKGWDEHLQRCRTFILKAVGIVNPSKVTVLGSGWLLELPLAEMSERIDMINLVDIIHPPEVIAQTATLKNISLIEEDVTGGLIEEVWKKAGKRTFLNKIDTLKMIRIPEYQPNEDPGMVISLNILSQMESLPVRLLKEKSKAGEQEFLSFRREIQENHIRFLLKHKSVLISDVSESFTAASGSVSEDRTIVAELPDSQLIEEWRWDFDLKGSDYNRKRSFMKVIGMVL
jgi:hypothetical protein